MEALSQNDINEILKGISIPSQPQIMADLQLAQAFDPPDMQEISKLISRDVSIAGNVIKVANSPFYGLSKAVTNIDQAIMLLGSKAVMNIVNGLALRQELVDISQLSEEDKLFLNCFWDSAEDTARAAQIISEQLQLEDPEAMYLLGLFHDGGIPLMVQHFKNYRVVMARGYTSEDQSLTEYEDREYRTNHAVLGYYLARSWKMPLPVCNAITEHHHLLRLLNDNVKAAGPLVNMIAILRLAEHLVRLHETLGQTENDLEWGNLAEPLMQYLNLTENDVLDLKAICEEHGIGL